jgi:hypothetical protein
MIQNLNPNWKNTIDQQTARLLVPKVNPEIWTNLSHNTKSADLRIVNFQKTLTKAGRALTKMTDSLLELRTKQVSQTLNNRKLWVSSFRVMLIGIGAFRAFEYRHVAASPRKLIKPHLKREYGALCSTRTPITDFIFGDDLQIYSDSHNIISLLKISLFLWQRKGRAYRPYQSSQQSIPQRLKYHNKPKN